MTERQCACVHADSVVCMAWRTNRTVEETMDANDECQCYCHTDDEEEDEQEL